MAILSIRIPDKLLHEVDTFTNTLHIPRTQYIRQAIEHMNDEMANKMRKQQLQQASLRVRKESMRVNAEFSEIEHDPKA